MDQLISAIDARRIEQVLLRHPGVREAAVISTEGESLSPQSLAYVTADLTCGQPDGSQQAAVEIVDRWNKLYDLAYTHAPLQPSFAAWSSSYTRQPIPQAQMQEWLQATLTRLHALEPKRVLEIGCGVGLLLQDLAPHTDVYVGTDISACALAGIRHWTSGRDDFRHVQLLNRPATAIADLGTGHFDTVILNSVVQYFPGIDYLLEVLRQATSLVRLGGTIFIGDVRHLGLLDTFHSSVQLARATDDISVAQLRRRIARAAAQDMELVIDPEFFRALPGRMPGISSTDLQLRRGRSDNELTHYRYDVVLRVDQQVQGATDIPQLDWSPAIDLGKDLPTLLSERQLTALRINSIPNARLTQDWLAQRSIAGYHGKATVGELRHRLRELAPEGVDPEDLWEGTQSRNHNIRMSWSRQPDCFDIAIWVRRHTDPVFRGTLTSAEPKRPWHTYANNPLLNRMRQQLVTQLLGHLRCNLGDDEMPAAVTILDQMPRTADGRIDPSVL
jgi:SAM-dependent methyltransferase